MFLNTFWNYSYMSTVCIIPHHAFPFQFLPFPYDFLTSWLLLLWVLCVCVWVCVRTHVCPTKCISIAHMYMSLEFTNWDWIIYHIVCFWRFIIPFLEVINFQKIVIYRWGMWNFLHLLWVIKRCSYWDFVVASLVTYRLL